MVYDYSWFNAFMSLASDIYTSGSNSIQHAMYLSYAADEGFTSLNRIVQSHLPYRLLDK